jgi:uncharacterized protein (TIGR02611 family)
MTRESHEHEPHEGLRDRLERLEDLAVEVEIETGRREETVEEAKRHILVRIGRIGAGVVVVLIGIALWPLPGPGTLTVIAGLALLSTDVPFARRLLQRLRDRLPSDEKGRMPKSVIALSLTGSLLVTGLSLWWSFGR